jgi:Heterokaryon incompatibility protein (HET)
MADPGSLEIHGDRIPKAIRDAIKVTCLIGEKHLRVDALCLTQDDPNSMKDGIRSMDLIYENALATIIAADGSDTSTGIRRLDAGYPKEKSAYGGHQTRSPADGDGCCRFLFKESKVVFQSVDVSMLVFKGQQPK